MGSLTLEIWLVIGLVIGGGVFMMLRALASSLRDVQRIIELRAQVLSLRAEYERRAAAAQSRRGLSPVSTSTAADTAEPHKQAA